MASLPRTAAPFIVCSFLVAIVGSASYASAADFKVVVKAGSKMFTPQRFTIKAGDNVIWINDDSENHWLTSTGPSSGGKVIGSENLYIHELMSPGETYRHAFEHPDVYHYFCAIHNEMWGTVVVKQ